MTNNEAVTIINPDRRRMALLQIKYRLQVEIKTGMTFSGGSTLQVARRFGYAGPRSKAKALAWAEAELAS
jgi:hypothetical protein